MAGLHDNSAPGDIDEITGAMSMPLNEDNDTKVNYYDDEFGAFTLRSETAASTTKDDDQKDQLTSNENLLHKLKFQASLSSTVARTSTETAIKVIVEWSSGTKKGDDHKSGTGEGFELAITPSKSNKEERAPLGQSQRKHRATGSDGDNAQSGKSQSSMPGSSKKRRVTGVAKPLGRVLATFDTKHYTIFDPDHPKVGNHIDHPFVSFSEYDSYTLYMCSGTVNVQDIPKRGVRLDDRMVGLVIESGVFSKKELNSNWAAEFDQNGMVRAQRSPLGNAAKEWKDAGTEDIYGNKVAEGQQGYYYLWAKGLQMLGGQESLNAGVYLKRPSFEAILCKGTTFKVTHRASVQLAVGDPADTTFGNHATPSNPLAHEVEEEKQAGGGASKKGKEKEADSTGSTSTRGGRGGGKRGNKSGK